MATLSVANAADPAATRFAPRITQNLVTNQGSTANQRPQLNGHARPFTLLSIDAMAGNGGSWSGSQLVVSGGDGRWTFTPIVDLPDGSYAFTATTSDGASNVFTWNIDHLAPTVGTLSLDNDSGTSASDGITRTQPLILGARGLGDPVGTSGLSRVDFTIDGLPLGSAGVSAGSATLNLGSILPDGRYVIAASVTDAAGNRTALPPLTVAVDTRLDQPLANGMGTDSGRSASDRITNDGTPTFSGRAEPSSTVTLALSPGGATATASTDASGVWSCTWAPALGDGDYSLTAEVGDAAGNPPRTSTALAFTIDTAAPVPFITGISDDSAAADLITNDSTLTVTGSAAEASGTVTVVITRGGVAAGSVTTTANAGGAWSLALPALADGAYLLTPSSTDIAGNTGTGPGLAVTVDTTLATPVIAAVADDTGYSASDFITLDLSQTVTGTCSSEPGAASLLVVDGVATYPLASPSWSQALALAPGTHALEVTTTDTAGNVRRASRSLVVDVLPPTAAITSIASDTGTSASDFITNDTTLTVNGTVSEAACDVLVELLDGAVVMGSATVRAGGSAWSWDASAHGLSGNPPRSYTFRATPTDPAGNTGPAATQAVAVDTLPPGLAAATIADLSPDTGVPGDRITSAKLPTFTGAATGLEASDRLRLYIDNVSRETFTAPTSPWSRTLTGAQLADGAHVARVVPVDQAGNEGVSSAAFSFTIDSVTPVPVLTAITIDSGVSASDFLTNDQVVDLAGSAEAGATVTLTRLGGATVSTVAAGGAWSFAAIDLTSGGQGAISLPLACTDIAGNTAAGAATITIDTIAPETVISGITSDSGRSASDLITNDRTLVIRGTANEPGCSVLVTRAGSAVGSATCAGSAPYAWSLDLTATSLADGVYLFTATATDRAGNTDSSPATASVTVDRTPPPTVPVLGGVSGDSGDSSVDLITNDSTPQISGTADAPAVVPGNRVTVYIDGAAKGTPALIAADGSWNHPWTGAALADGRHAITLRAEDIAGNFTAYSHAAALVIDTAAAPPVVSGVDQDTGRSASDFITSDQSPVISGTAEAGAHVQVLVDGTLSATVTADPGGAWSHALPGAPLADGARAITAVQTDIAGNVSVPSSARHLVVDTIAPGRAVVGALSSDNGLSGSDRLTNDRTLVFTGSAEADATVALQLDGVAVGSVLANGSGAWELDRTAVSLADGVHALVATAIDAAGNIGAASTPFLFIIDGTMAVPVVTGFANDSASAGDRITSDTTLVVTGTGKPGSDLTLSISPGGTFAGVVAGDGVWTVDAGASVLADGLHTIIATTSDAAGNSATSAAFNVTIDTVAPVAPVFTSIDTDTGTVPWETTDQTLVIHGTAEPGSTVTVSCLGSVLGVATATGGAWSLDLTATVLADGSYPLTAVATDAAGNTGPAGSQIVIVDTVLAPKVAILGLSSDTAAQGDWITADNTLVFSGIAEPGSAIAIRLDGGSPVAATATADPLGGWTATPTALIADGSHTVTATATDGAGNATTASHALVVDTTAPAAPAITAVSDDTGTAGDFLTSDRTLVLSGNAEAGALVTVRLAGNAIAVVGADAGGHWVFDFGVVGLADGSYAFSATATDPAGNVSTPSAVRTVVVDGTAPASPVLTAIGDDSGSPGDFLTRDRTLVFSGTAEANVGVNIALDGAFIAVVQSDAAGAWVLDHTAVTLAEGAHSLVATASDAAGNTGAASPAFLFTIDGSMPAPVVTGFAGDSGAAGDRITSDTSLVVAGTGKAGSVLSLAITPGATFAGMVAGDGTWSVDAGTTVLADGLHAIIATTSDAAGNSATSAAFNLTIDTVAPAAPVFTGIDTDTGTVPWETTDQTLVIHGTAEAGSSVTVSYLGSPLSTVIALGGTWALDLTSVVLPDGSYAFTAVATDAAGNTGPAGSQTIFVDTALEPRVAILGLSGDTGIQGDWITADPTQVFSGIAEPGAAIAIRLDGGATVAATATADALGSWTASATAVIADGSHTVAATATDGAGNATTASHGLVIDTTAPAAPSITAVSADTGTAGDFRTSDRTLILSGHAEAMALVTVRLAGSAIGAVSADAGGLWSFDFGTVSLADGTYLFSAVASDAAGNQSASSADRAVVVDGTAPAAPVIAALSSDTGISAGDRLTSDRTLVFSGTAEAGARVAIRYDGVSIATVTAAAGGAWVLDYTSVALPEGSHNLVATASDAAGNLSAASSTFAFTIDAGMVEPVVAGFADDSGIAGDRITNDPALVISGTGEAGAGLVVTIAPGATVAGVVAGDGSWSVDAGALVLADGVHSITAFTSDGAGNSATSAAFNLTIDTVAPAAPVFTSIDTDTGTVPWDTTDQTLVIHGTAEAGTTVTVSYLGTPIASVPATGGAWTLDLTSVTLPAGSYLLTATASDVAGNTGAAGSQTITVDTALEPKVAILGLSRDTATQGDWVTADNTLVFSGIAEAGSAIAIRLDGGATVAGTATADAQGSWTATVTDVIPDGGHTVVATATDGASNAASASRSLVVDTTAPAAPAITAISDDTGTAGDFVTSDRTLVLSGTAEAGSLVTVRLAGIALAAVSADAGGRWSLDLTTATLADGSYPFSAVASDAAGNQSAASATRLVVVDGLAPSAPAVLALSDDSGIDGDRITSDRTLVFSGSAEAGSRVEMRLDGLAIATVTADGAGGWVLDHTATTLAEGAHTLLATAIDAAGSSGAASQPFLFTIDATMAAPVVVGIANDSGAAGDRITNDSTLVVTGTGEAGSTLALAIVPGGSFSGTVAGDGTWSVDAGSTVLSDGVHAIIATTSDAAGNSAGSATFSVTVDTVAPAAPVFTSIDTDTGTVPWDTTDQTLVIHGTAETGSTVTVSYLGSPLGVVPSVGGAWTLDLTAVTLPDGIYPLTAVATDAAGNTGPAGSQTIVVDTALEPKVAILGLSGDSAVLGDWITADNTLVFSGVAEPGSAIAIRLDGGATVAATAAADGLGGWTATVTAAIADGVHTVAVTATDGAGNTTSASRSVVVDTVAPSAPAIIIISDDTGTAGDFITSDRTLVLGGIAEAGTQVTVSLAGSLIGAVTADAGGRWSFDFGMASLADGSYQFSAVASDAAGNVSPPSAVRTVVVDATAPPAPAITALSGDTGSSASDRLTRDRTLVFTGTAEADARVAVRHDGVLIATVTADGAGAWILDHSTVILPEGSHVLSATASDAAGNASAASPAFAYIIDASMAAPVVAGFADDSGVAGDRISNDPTLVITGTGKPGAILSVSIAPGATAAGVVAGDGSWSVDAGAISLADGAHAIVAITSDAAGNSATSAAFNLTIDTVAPAAPVFTGIDTDTGTVPWETTDQTLVIHGTAEAGSTVTVSYLGSAIGMVTAAGGAWTLDLIAITLPNGTYPLTATATDVAGNTGPAGSQTIVVDTALQPSVAILGLSGDTAIQGDWITADSTLVFSGIAEAGSAIAIRLDGGTAVIATAAATSTGSWTASVTAAIADGSHTVRATATDGAGNSASATHAVVVDTIAPAAPAITAISDDTGSAGDFVTSDRTLVLAGTAEAGAQVTVRLAGSALATATADAGGRWTLDLTSASLADGSYPFSAFARDAAGNQSAASAIRLVVVDGTAPAAPSIQRIADDTGGSASDRITSDTTPQVHGLGEAGTIVTLLRNGSAVATATVAADGSWSAALAASALSDGSYAVSAFASDRSGNAGAASTPLTVTVDTRCGTPVLLAISPDSGRSASDRITNAATPVLSGRADPGDSVTVRIDGIQAGIAIADGSGGWSLALSAALADGAHAITLAAGDLAGNLSATAGPWTMAVDTVAPSHALLTGVTSDTGVSDSDLLTSDTTLLLSGTAEAGARVTVSVAGVALGSADADGTGAWSLDLTSRTLSAGTYPVVLTAADVAGNASPPSPARSVVVDTANQPDVTILGVVPDTNLAGDAVTSTGTLAIAGIAEAGAAVTVFDGGVLLGSTTALADGSWSLPATLAEGGHRLTATSVDLAGLPGGPSADFPLTVDLTPPAAPVFTAISTDSAAADFMTNDRTLVILGTAEAGAQVRVVSDGRDLGIVTAGIDGGWSLDLTSFGIPDGTYHLSATAMDPAGNVGVAGAQDVVVDGVVGAPSFVGVRPDTGTAGDWLTSSTAPLVIGNGEPASVVTLSLDGTEVGIVMVDAAGNWQVDLAGLGLRLADGAHLLAISARDAIGNQSPAGITATLVVDTAVTAPRLTAISDDTGSIGDLRTADSTLVLRGLADPAAGVAVRIDGALLATVSAAADGTWTADLTATVLAEGGRVLSLASTDAAGNTASAADLTLVIDSAVPLVPVITQVFDGAGAIPSGGSTWGPWLTVQGTAEAGSLVVVLADGLPAARTVAGPDGRWAAQVVLPHFGQVLLTATAEDAVGNRSGALLPWVITLLVDDRTAEVSHCGLGSGLGLLLAGLLVAWRLALGGVRGRAARMLPLLLLAAAWSGAQGSDADTGDFIGLDEDRPVWRDELRLSLLSTPTVRDGGYALVGHPQAVPNAWHGSPQVELAWQRRKTIDQAFGWHAGVGLGWMIVRGDAQPVLATDTAIDYRLDVIPATLRLGGRWRPAQGWSCDATALGGIGPALISSDAGVVGPRGVKEYSHDTRIGAWLSYGAEVAVMRRWGSLGIGLFGRWVRGQTSFTMHDSASLLGQTAQSRTYETRLSSQGLCGGLTAAWFFR
ncbi:MAG: Ig-like domain-containing protein [Planctomycetes bacterium]|nr:Ig-like domain-containing protein [Planctomycetota bacterium]